MKNIQLFGGPGTGKSTTAAGLFCEMKLTDYNVEIIHEYAKDLTYGKDFVRLTDQLHLLGEQHHRLVRLKNNVDYTIHDSPFLMGMSYLDNDDILPIKEFKQLVIALYNSYDNINIFLKRNTALTYQEYGRNQNLEEAIQKDIEIKKMLDDNKIPYIVVKMGKKSIKQIMKIIKNS